MNKIITLAVILSLVVAASMLLTPLVTAMPNMKRPADFIEATIEGGSPQSVDYSYAYDTASGEIVFNTMDTLIMFNAEHTDSYIPSIAKSWTSTQLGIGGAGVDSGIPIAGLNFENPDNQTGSNATYYWRYDFQIRGAVGGITPILFQPYPAGYVGPAYSRNMTLADIAYSFQRTMVQDRYSGPQWMLQEPLLDQAAGDSQVLGGIADLTDPVQVNELGRLIEASVQYDDTDVWFNVMFPSAYAPFLQILCQTWSSIESKQWINAYVIGQLYRNDWSGDWSLKHDGWTQSHTGWIDQHLSGEAVLSPLDTPYPLEYGSGPFILTLGTPDYVNNYFALTRFVGYFRGWNNNVDTGYGGDFPKMAGASPAGYVNSVEVTWNYVWGTRKIMFLSGDCDFVAVPDPSYYGELYKSGDLSGTPLDGIRVIRPLPELTADACFFTFDISPSAYANVYTDSKFHEYGVPADFFGGNWGIYIRKAFAQAFNCKTLMRSSQVQLRVLSLTPTSFDFNITVSPSAQNVAPGGSTTYQISVTVTQGGLHYVYLNCSGLPPGTTGSFNPPLGYPTPTFSSTLTIQNSTNIPCGNYTLTIKGTSGELDPSRSVSHSTTVLFLVPPTPPPPPLNAPFDFSVTVLPPSQSVAPSGSTIYHINVTLNSGLAENPYELVDLTCPDLPTGMTCTFSPSYGVPPFLSTLNVTVSSCPTCPAGGDHTFTVTGSSRSYIRQVYLEEASAPATAIIPGLNYYDPSVIGYSYGRGLANASLNNARDSTGAFLSAVGFTITLCYNTGNMAREKACQLLKANIEGLNIHYHCNIVALDSNSYLAAAATHQLPCFMMGWSADFTDPHDFAFHFYATAGSFPLWQLYSNATMDNLISQGIATPDGSARQAIYTKVQQLAIDDCPSFTIAQPLGRHWERDWVVGYYYNPAYPSLYFYNMWKWYYVPLSSMSSSAQPFSNDRPFDVNYDGVIDMADIGMAAASFSATYKNAPTTVPYWVFRADVNNDGLIDMFDIGSIASHFLETGPTWHP